MESFIKNVVNSKILAPMRDIRTVEEISPFLSGCRNILDVGSEEGRLAKQMQEFSGIPFTCCDLVIQPDSEMPVIQFDGKTLPFEDGSFDGVSCIDVFHHIPSFEEQKTLLLEMKRVAKNFVVLKDHYYLNSLEHYILKISDYVVNLVYGIPLPLNFSTLSTWRRLFRETGLRVKESHFYRINSIDPLRHVVFKLVRKRERKNVPDSSEGGKK